MNYPLAGVTCLILTACAASPSGGKLPGSPADGVVDGSGPSEWVFGTIEFYGDPVRVGVPTTAELGQPFVVTVITYGGGCIEKGETKVEVEVEVEALRAEVRPYDYDISPALPANGGCTDELNLYEHTTTVTFTEAGMAEIVFYGQKKNASGVTQTGVTRTLEVRQSP